MTMKNVLLRGDLHIALMYVVQLVPTYMHIYQLEDDKWKGLL